MTEIEKLQAELEEANKWEDHDIAKLMKAEAELSELKSKFLLMAEAVKTVSDSKFTTYKARNGREVGIEDTSGEMCYIVPFDSIHQAEQALSTTQPDIQRIRDEIRAEAWQPIETAPKDGKRIIGGEWRTVKAYIDHKGNIITPEKTFFVQYYCRWYTHEQLLGLDNASDLPDDDPFFESGFCEEGPMNLIDEVAVKCSPTCWQPVREAPSLLPKKEVE